MFIAGLPQFTVKSYRSCSNKYTRFCMDRGMTPFPVEEKTVCCFIAALYLEGLAGSSVKSYLATICFSQIALGMGDPYMSEWPRLSYAVWSFKKKASGSRATNRLPITPKILKRLKSVWGKRRTPKRRVCCGQLLACVSSASCGWGKPWYHLTHPMIQRCI